MTNCKNCGAAFKPRGEPPSGIPLVTWLNSLPCEYCGTRFVYNNGNKKQEITSVDVRDMKIKEIEKLITEYSKSYNTCIDIFCLFKAYPHTHAF